jgi:hypothetical protein
LAFSIGAAGIVRQANALTSAFVAKRASETVAERL